MSEFTNILFYLMCSTLLTHEMDAVHKHEWRLLFILRNMEDKPARQVFVLMHIPLITIIIWLLSHSSETVRFWSIYGLDIFAVIHAGLHWRLSGHPKYEFDSVYSRLLIYGAAVLATIHVVLLVSFQ